MAMAPQLIFLLLFQFRIQHGDAWSLTLILHEAPLMTQPADSKAPIMAHFKCPEQNSGRCLFWWSLHMHTMSPAIGCLLPPTHAASQSQNSSFLW